MLKLWITSPQHCIGCRGYSMHHQMYDTWDWGVIGNSKQSGMSNKYTRSSNAQVYKQVWIKNTAVELCTHATLFLTGDDQNKLWNFSRLHMKSLGDSSDFIHLCELCCCELIDFTLAVKITICMHVCGGDWQGCMLTSCRICNTHADVPWWWCVCQCVMLPPPSSWSVWWYRRGHCIQILTYPCEGVLPARKCPKNYRVVGLL